MVSVRDEKKERERRGGKNKVRPKANHHSNRSVEKGPDLTGPGFFIF
jgi:hypothetical protein